MQPFTRSSRDKLNPQNPSESLRPARWTHFASMAIWQSAKKKRTGRNIQFPARSRVCDCYTVNGAPLALAAVNACECNVEPSAAGLPLRVILTSPLLRTRTP